jgi:hypothetical protein
MATARLRLTATTLAGLRDVEVATGVATATVPEGPGEPAGLACMPLTGSDTYTGSPACTTLRTAAAGLAGFYGQVADEVGRAGRGGELTEVPPPPVTGAAIPRTASTATLPLHHPHLLWVQDHLHHLSESAQTVSGPALRVAEARRRPWWR